MPRAKPREKAVEALLALAAERPFETVTLADIAARADLTLAALRESYDGRVAILSDYVRQVDERVLAGVDPALASESLRERLFDVLFARFEAHAPHRAGTPQHCPRGAPRSASGARSQPYRHDLDELDAERGRDIRKRGRGDSSARRRLALIWAQVLRVWLTDQDPGLARTMAALDKRLREAERMVIRLQRLERCLPRRRSREQQREASADGDMAEGHPT